jgi:PAS domain S-box-containing protein
MRSPSDPPEDTKLGDLIGLGERSHRKSYYPELQQRLNDLERFKAFVDFSHDAIFLVEVPDAKIVDVNESSCRQLGYARDELLGRSVFDISELGLDEQVKKLMGIREVGAGKRLLTYSVLHRENGTRFPVEITLAKMLFQETAYVIAVARDITRRKEAEEALAERVELAELGAEIGKALTMSGSLDETLQRCAESLVRHTRAAAGRIWTVDPKDPQVLEIKASAGSSTRNDLPRERKLVGEPMIGRIAAERRPYLSNEISGEPALADLSWIEREGIAAFAGHPLLVGERLMGVVALFFKKPMTEAVLSAVATVADEIAVGIDRLRAVDALWDSEMQRTRMQAQFEFAARMQSYLLPTRPPETAGFDIAASCLAAHQVGGDFYDWQEMSPGLLTLTFGDVMGKGMAAAMLMATVKAALRAVSRATSPQAALHLAERSLHRDLERSESFVTLFHGQLDVTARTLSFVDCGHGLGFLRRAGGKVEELQPRCLPFGIFSNGFQEGRLTFNKGDALVLYSDGLTDALPENKRGRDVLAKQLEGAADAQEMVDRLNTMVVADAELPLEDDLTVLVVLAK